MGKKIKGTLAQVMVHHKHHEKKKLNWKKKSKGICPK
jgi:hypothetical protein